MSGHVLPLRGSDAAWSGGVLSPSVRCVLAPNPSPWTLDGTNTWVLGAPGSDAVVVVDPGPDDSGHLDNVRGAVREQGRCAGVLLTHGHVDHSQGARLLAESLGVGVRALDSEHRLGSEGLAGGDVVDLGSWRIDVVATPGHSFDSLSFVVPHDGAVLTGDTVLGRGTSLVAWPDGLLGDYLDSLRRLQRVVEGHRTRRLLPGHGPVIDDPARALEDYLTHRLARLAEVREVVASGVSEPADIVATVYADVPRAVWPAAELTVRAQLAYLDSS